MPEIEPKPGEKNITQSLEEIISNAPPGAIEAVKALNDVAGTNYPLPEEAAAPSGDNGPASGDAKTDEPQPAPEKIDASNDPIDKSGEKTSLPRLDEIKSKVKGVADRLKGGELKPEDEVSPESDNDSSDESPSEPPSEVEILVGTVDDDSDANPEPERKHSLVENAHASLLKTRVALLNLIKEDPESRRLVQMVLQEGLEAQYLKASAVTDQLRARNLKAQLSEVNSALSALAGQRISITALYKADSSKDPQTYPPLTTTEGLFALVKYHKDLAIQIFSASEVASETAEIEAQKALVPLRAELDVIRIDSKENVAARYILAAPQLKEEARLRGEVRGEQISGIIGPILTGIGAAPLYVIRGPAEKFSKWVDDAEDKGDPISAVAGSAITTGILISTGVLGSPLLSLGVGIVGGAVIGIATWKVTSAFSHMAAAQLKEWSHQLEEKFSPKPGNGKNGKK